MPIVFSSMEVKREYFSGIFMPEKRGMQPVPENYRVKKDVLPGNKVVFLYIVKVIRVVEAEYEGLCPGRIRAAVTRETIVGFTLFSGFFAR